MITKNIPSSQVSWVVMVRKSSTVCRCNASDVFSSFGLLIPSPSF
jgi:hypothetical protein